MNFQSPLIKGKLIKRYKRFMADIELLNGDVVTAHCANSGSMLSINEPGSEVWLSPANNPNRKLQYTWEMIRVKRSLVGVNTQNPNLLVTEAIVAGKIPALSGVENLQREIKYGTNSRVDILLSMQAGLQCYVEVKNVTMRRDLTDGAPAEFPDGITARGTKHLAELSKMVSQGKRAIMFYLVQRHDACSMTIARDIDPTYGKALDAARASGVEVLAYNCRLSPKMIKVADPVDFV